MTCVAVLAALNAIFYALVSSTNWLTGTLIAIDVTVFPIVLLALCRSRTLSVLSVTTPSSVSYLTVTYALLKSFLVQRERGAASEATTKYRANSSSTIDEFERATDSFFQLQHHDVSNDETTPKSASQPAAHFSEMKDAAHLDMKRRRSTSTYSVRRLSIYGTDDTEQGAVESTSSPHTAKKGAIGRRTSCESMTDLKEMEERQRGTASTVSTSASISRRVSVESMGDLRERDRKKAGGASISRRVSVEAIDDAARQGAETRTVGKKKSLRKSFSAVTFSSQQPTVTISTKLSRRHSSVTTNHMRMFQNQVNRLVTAFENESSSSSFYSSRRASSRKDSMELLQDATPLLLTSLRKVPVLRHTTNLAMTEILQKLECVHVKKGDVIAEDGSTITHLSIVSDGQLVHVRDSSSRVILGPGDAFGMYGLIYTVVNEGRLFAKTDATIWTIAGKEYRKMREQQSRKDITFALKRLQSHRLFYILNIRTITLIVESFAKRTFQDGEIILHAGHNVRDLFLVAECQGTVREAVRGDRDGTETTTATLRTYDTGDFFGEEDMLRDRPAAHDFVACGQVVCFWIPKELFTRTVDQIDQILRAMSFDDARGGQNNEALSTRTDKSSTMTTPDDAIADKSSSKMSPTRSITPPAELETYAATDFDVVACIGIGAFGRVVLARHLQTNCPFAIKQIAKMRRAKRSRKDEIEIMRSMKHPNIAHIAGRFLSCGKMYLVLPYYQGGDMLSRLVNRRRMSIEESRFYVASVYLALVHIHRHNIIYRDLKLENIMLTNTGHVKLIDFGLAKRFDVASQTGGRTFTVCGTVEYMSPEMITSAGYTTLNDIWALGVLFHEFISGKPPFGDRRKATYQEVYEEVIFYTSRRKQMELEYSLGTSTITSLTRFNTRLVSHFFPYFHMTTKDSRCMDLLLQLLSPIATMRPRESIFCCHPIFRNQQDGVSGQIEVDLPTFSWDDLASGKMVPPYVPSVGDPYDTRYFDDFNEDLENFFGT